MQRKIIMEGKIIIQGKIMIQGKIGREDHIYWIAQTGRQGGMFSQSRIPFPLKEEMSIEDMGGKSYKNPTYTSKHMKTHQKRIQTHKNT